MNVRNKIIVVVLSFSIIFNSFSSCYANAFVSSVPSIPSPMVSAIATVGVGCGVVYQSVQDIGNFVRAFYDYNADRWEDVKNAFVEGCSVAKDGVLTIGSTFLNYCEETLNNICNKIDQSNGNTIKGYYLGYPVFHDYPTANTLPYRYSVGIPTITPTKSDFTVGGLSFDFQGTSGSVYIYKVYGGSYSKTAYIDSEYPFRLIAYVNKPYVHFGGYHVKDGNYYSSGIAFSVPLDSVTFSETWANSFDWGNGIGKDVIDGKVSVNAPANVSDLVNKGADVVTGNPSYDLPVGGVVSVGGVTHDTLEFDDSITFPVDAPSDIPSDTPSDTPSNTPGSGSLPVFPPFGSGLDFTPITQSSFIDKFPFSLAKDIKNIVSVFDVEPKAPKFTVPIVSEELEIDLTQFNLWASIIRFFVLIGFMVSLINITRKVIG